MLFSCCASRNRTIQGTPNPALSPRSELVHLYGGLSFTCKWGSQSTHSHDLLLSTSPSKIAKLFNRGVHLPGRQDHMNLITACPDWPRDNRSLVIYNSSLLLLPSSLNRKRLKPQKKASPFPTRSHQEFDSRRSHSYTASSSNRSRPLLLLTSRHWKQLL